MTIKAILLVFNLAGGQATAIPYENMDLCRKAEESIQAKFRMVTDYVHAVCIPADNSSVVRGQS